MEGLDSLREAGRIARRVREKALDLVREGMSIIELCNIIEGLIIDEGAVPAFPCNICIDEVAAHYTPSLEDTSIITSGSLVKVDLGVSLDGYIADTAVTISLNSMLEPLVEAVNTALLESIKIIKPGVQASTIGGIIQKTIVGRGFKPIKNLTGHEISRYNLHAGLSIPNIQTSQSSKLQLGHVYAIEPFATTPDGAGEVISSSTVTIYRLNIERIMDKKLSEEEKMLAEILYKKFNRLPYTTRWIKEFEKFREVHIKMVKAGRVYSYPVLVEKRGRPVAQAEHTIIITEEGCEIIT
ncbi:MAG: type II methionyl aminopeptidase [Candidatus Caldarchaeales archaeon]